MVVDPWIWAVCLIILGLGLAVLEVFFPSAGILGFLSACAILGGFCWDSSRGRPRAW